MNRSFPNGVGDASDDFFSGLFAKPDGAQRLLAHLRDYALVTGQTWLAIGECPPLLEMVQQLVVSGDVRMAVVAEVKLFVALTTETAVMW